MGTYFNKFPRVLYSPSGALYSNYVEATNILFRFGIIKEVVNSTAAYEIYTIVDGDTPENLAQKAYKDAEACWIIMMANNIHDPTWDWPLDDRSFRKYIRAKYGSIATAKTGIHHYEKVITREERLSNTIVIERLQINQANVSYTYPDNVPYETYADLPDEGEYSVYEVDGNTINEKINRNAVTNYDYEHQINESKRQIKVIKVEYYPAIMEELNRITNYKPRFYRNVS
jgi:hypothetical protein